MFEPNVGGEDLVLKILEKKEKKMNEVAPGLFIKKHFPV
jgi:hypothetical protein